MSSPPVYPAPAVPRTRPVAHPAGPVHPGLTEPPPPPGYPPSRGDPPALPLTSLPAASAEKRGETAGSFNSSPQTLPARLLPRRLPLRGCAGRGAGPAPRRRPSGLPRWGGEGAGQPAAANYLR